MTRPNSEHAFEEALLQHGPDAVLDTPGNAPPHGSNDRYSTSADRPMTSTMVIDNSAPNASVSRIAFPSRKGTGCCRPSSMAILSAYR